MLHTVKTWLAGNNLSVAMTQAAETAYSFVILFLLIILAFWLARRFFLPLLERAIRKSSNKWDDAFVATGFFKRFALLAPVIVAYLSADLMFPLQNSVAEFIKRLAMSLFVLFSIRVLDALLRSVQEIFSTHAIARDKPIRGYFQALMIIAYVMAGIFIVAILTDQSPWGIFSVLGGLTAVLLLVFKDTILGFVAGLQLAAHDMVRVGDWIEMPQYGADGDVIDISIHTVKVQNWDKTIATIPTYALVSDAFRNWRGMKESGGRRIKRAFYIDMHSIRFCTSEMLEQFSRIELLKDYLAAKGREITAYNRDHHVDTSLTINGRQQTNIGVLRAYIIAYLRQHPKIHQGMTFLVRHLTPTPQGLPIEIYVFSNDQVWANYEGIQADIFDHILAATPLFGLRIFQYPSGHDFRGILRD